MARRTKCATRRQPERHFRLARLARQEDAAADPDAKDSPDQPRNLRLQKEYRNPLGKADMADDFFQKFFDGALQESLRVLSSWLSGNRATAVTKAV